MDKNNLKRRVAELDEMVKSLLKAPSTQQQTQLSSKSHRVRLTVNDGLFVCLFDNSIVTTSEKMEI